MAHAFSSSAGSVVRLFDEDFDLPPASEEPEVIEPLYTSAEMMEARATAALDSRDSALLEANVSSHAAAARALGVIAAQMADAHAEAMTIAEQSAEAIARLLLDCFAVAFPALSARHGPAEMAAVLRKILPALRREPKIAIRISPHLVAAMTDELHALDADVAARVRLIPTDAVEPGDARVTWENGSATRDTASLWNQIEGILAPAGLLNVKQPAKEHELVE
jgi:flagellar assembly protein FliH